VNRIREVAVLLPALSDDAIAVSLMIVPVPALIVTASRMVQVLLGRISLFSLHTTDPVPPTEGVVAESTPPVPDSATLEKVVPAGILVVSTSCVAPIELWLQTLKA
jgi:hypothetical protein